MRRDVFINGALLCEGGDYRFIGPNLEMRFEVKDKDVVIVHTYFLGLRVGTSVVPPDQITLM